MVARLTIICKVGGLIIGVIVSEAVLLNRIYLLFKKMTRKYIAGGFRTGLLLLNRSTTNQARGRRRRLKGMIATEGVLPRSGCPHLACCGSPLMSPGIVASRYKIPNRPYQMLKRKGHN